MVAMGSQNKGGQKLRGKTLPGAWSIQGVQAVSNDFDSRSLIPSESMLFIFIYGAMIVQKTIVSHDPKKRVLFRHPYPIKP